MLVQREIEIITNDGSTETRDVLLKETFSHIFNL